MNKSEMKWPYYLYAAIFLIFVGILVAPFVECEKPVQSMHEMSAGEEDHSLHFSHDHSAMHALLEVSPATAPSVELVIVKDQHSGWNLHINTQNFTFAPEQVNKPHQDNVGHAHVYVNGEKLSRIYAPDFYLADFPAGDYEVSVTLNSNDHFDYSVDGKRISDSVTITQ